VALLRSYPKCQMSLGSRKLLAGQIAISYSITVPDYTAAESLQASITAVPPTALVVQLKAAGLDDVSGVLVVVSDDICLCPVVPATAEPLAKTVPTPVVSSPPDEGAAPLGSPNEEVVSLEDDEEVMSLQDYEVAEQTPAPEPESAPDQDMQEDLSLRLVVSFWEVSWKCSILAPITAVTAAAIEQALAGARYQGCINGISVSRVFRRRRATQLPFQKAESTGLPRSNCILCSDTRCSVVGLAFFVRVFGTIRISRCEIG